ncbi:MAG: lysylphosphatidylglycerol synthase transmembrane domain-containing protein [Polaromonas sp.]
MIPKGPAQAADPAPVKPPFKLPFKQLLLVLGAAATAYAAALLIWGDRSGASLADSWSFLGSWAGLQVVALCLLSYGLRGVRWRLWMAHYGRHFGALQGMRLYLAGYAFTPTPGNVGEAARGLMLVRKPLSARQSLAVFGAERLADLLCLLLLSLPALGWLIERGAVPAAAPWLPGLLAGGALLALLLLGRLLRHRRALLLRFAWLQEAWHCLAVRPLLWFALTLAAWAAQGLAVWLIGRDLGLQLPGLMAASFYAVAMVAGALSALPAGLGGAEAVLAGLLVAHGATSGQALAVTVLTRLFTLWLAVAIGVAALFYSAAIRKEISFR